jgi:glycosyltransferase involved in cell wall biosynthesis
MQNILFVLYHNFKANSAIHVHNFANQLTACGLDCVVAVPSHKETAASLSNKNYKTIDFSEVNSLKTVFGNGQGPDIVHAWTPREVVRIFCEKLSKLYSFKLFIHLEDNEEFILQKNTHQSLQELSAIDERHFPTHLSHPVRYRKFLELADGITIIIDRLQAFVPSHVPYLVLWPGVDKTIFFPRDRDQTLAAKLGIPLNCTVLCYTGNVHAANAREVRSLYLAVAMLNREGHPTILIRTGQDFHDFLGADDKWAKKYTIELGYVESHAAIADILALADILIQPGKKDAFNDYRLPSKLPEFLAMGKPVVLPETNIGRFTKSMEQAVPLTNVDALNIVETVKFLMADTALRERLGAGAVAFADTYLDWSTNGSKLLHFYQTHI